jgi:hypothetical protein
MGMINQHSWMFLPSFKDLREKFGNGHIVYSMTHLGAHAFEEIGGEVVQVTSFVSRKVYIGNYKGYYIRLVDISNPENKRIKAIEAINNASDSKIVFKTGPSKFFKVPGIPFAYWISEEIINAFTYYPKLGEVLHPKTGFTTGDNNIFLRLWHEINYNKRGQKWFPLRLGFL